MYPGKVAGFTPDAPEGLRSAVSRQFRTGIVHHISGHSMKAPNHSVMLYLELLCPQTVPMSFPLISRRRSDDLMFATELFPLT